MLSSNGRAATCSPAAIIPSMIRDTSAGRKAKRGRRLTSRYSCTMRSSKTTVMSPERIRSSICAGALRVERSPEMRTLVSRTIRTHRLRALRATRISLSISSVESRSVPRFADSWRMRESASCALTRRNTRSAPSKFPATAPVTAQAIRASRTRSPLPPARRRPSGPARRSGRGDTMSVRTVA